MKKVFAAVLAVLTLLTACGKTAKKESGASRPVETEAVASIDENSAEAVNAEPKTVTVGILSDSRRSVLCRQLFYGGKNEFCGFCVFEFVSGMRKAELPA